MSEVLDRSMTLEAFLTWERKQELRYEFDGSGPMAMNGGTLLHGLIASRVMRALGDRLAELPSCTVFAAAKILVQGRVRYPDLVVTCAMFDGHADIVPEPVVVIEVLSPSTAATDRFDKNLEYAATPSIQHYVMLEQVRRGATIFTRTSDDWAGHVVTSDDVLHLTALGIDLPLGDCYGDLVLGRQTETAAGRPPASR